MVTVSCTHKKNKCIYSKLEDAKHRPNYPPAQTCVQPGKEYTYIYISVCAGFYNSGMDTRDWTCNH